MKFIKSAVSLFLIIQLPLPIFSQASISGIITDAGTGERLPGANIYMPDLKTGTTSDGDGKYEINNLPSVKVQMQVTYLGYESQTVPVDLAVVNEMDFQLKLAVTEIKEVVITGQSQASEKNKTPTPVSVITHAELMQSSSTNLIAALAKQPGISQVTTGPAISKPTIRGLGYNRIVVMNDGIRQEGQQWGDEHGIEIDEFSVNRVEILKGPSSLMYGSDAIAGVINLLSAPTLPPGTIMGNIMSNYQTNNGLAAYSGNIAGNMDGFIWDIRYSNKSVHDYKNKFDGYVYGSRFNEQAANAILGLNKKWGYGHLYLNYYAINPGIVEGERDSVSGEFVKTIALNDSTTEITPIEEDEIKSYTNITPHQEIRHYKASINHSLILGNSILQTTIGFQQNNRKEFADIFFPEAYGLYFKLNTLNYDVRFLFPDKNNWQTAIGINGMSQQSLNKGTEFLVPAYELFDAGIFAVAKKTVDALSLSSGIRYDLRKISGDDFYSPATEELLFKGFRSSFSAISGSMGVAYALTDDLFLKLNISRGFRAPNIAEIGANGIHEGTYRYEIGDPALKAETSLQTDFAVGFSGEHLSVEFDLFDNMIDHFIYLRKLNSVNGGDSVINAEGQDVLAFKYVQGDAQLFGGELTVDVHPHPLDWLHFENSFSYVNAQQLHATDSTKYLPNTPAPRVITEISAEFNQANHTFRHYYFNVQIENYFRQEHIFSAYDTETATPNYTLINIGTGADLSIKNRTACSIYISLNNLTDAAYQNHMSRLKYAPVNYATGNTGIYEMGRNFSVKVNVPLYFKN